MKHFLKENYSYIKSIIITLLLQALIYFTLNIILKNHIILKTSFNIPLIKWMIFIYNSWYPLIFYISYLIYKDNNNLYKKLIFTMILGFLMSHITFIIYPSSIVRNDILVNNFIDFIIYVTYKFDNPVNCLPSIHALVCYILIYYTLKSNLSLKRKIILNIYLFLIILSTLFVHQHIPMDLLLALLYSIISIITIKKLYPKLKETLKFLF